jgi:hypothetical protein
MPEQFTTWAAAIETSLSHALSLFLAAIPKIVGFLIIVGIGWVLAAVVAGAMAALLRRLRFNDLAHRSGLAGVVAGTGMETDAIGFVAISTRWFIRLIALVVAFDALGLPAVSTTLRQLALWLPNLVVALVILVLGGLIANAFRGAVRTSIVSAGVGDPGVMAALAHWGVWAFAIVLALYQVGVASELVATLFTAIVGALALAIGLAFGLGGRDTAKDIINDLYARLPSSNAHVPSSRREASVRRDISRA